MGPLSPTWFVLYHRQMCAKCFLCVAGWWRYRIGAEVLKSAGRLASIHCCLAQNFYSAGIVHVSVYLVLNYGFGWPKTLCRLVRGVQGVQQGHFKSTGMARRELGGTRSPRDMDTGADKTCRSFHCSKQDRGAWWDLHCFEGYDRKKDKASPILSKKGRSTRPQKPVTWDVYFDVSPLISLYIA